MENLPECYHGESSCLYINPSNAEAIFVKSKKTKPCHVEIHWKALDEYCQMSTHVKGFSHFSFFWHHFVLTKLAPSSIRAKMFRTCL